MKYLLLISLILFQVSCKQAAKMQATTPTRQDYEDVMTQFVSHYNNSQTDEICNFFVPYKGECFWRSVVAYQDPIPKYGKIESFKYMGKVTQDPNDIVAFKVVYEHVGTKAMSFHLDKHLRFGTFRFITTDDEIEKMLAKTE